MLQPIIENSYLVEVNLGTPSQGKRINFQYIPQLEGATIYAIQTFSATDLTKSPNNVAVVSTIGLAGCTVTFCVGDDEKLYIVPLSDLRSQNISGFQRMFNNMKINLTKSYITIQDATSIVPLDSVLFQFIYRNK